MAVLFLSSMDDPVAWESALTPLVPGLDLRVWPEIGEPDDVEVALVWQAPPGDLARYRNLKGIVALGAGVDHILADPELPAGLLIARIVDPKLTAAMTEYVLLAVLRHHRGFDHFERCQRTQSWQFRAPPDTARRRGSRRPARPPRRARR